MSSLRQTEYRSHANDRGVKQKNIFVLCYSPMPAILVELGYMSNQKEEKFMNSPEAMELYANAIFMGFEQYRNNWQRRQLNQNETTEVVDVIRPGSETSATTAESEPQVDAKAAAKAAKEAAKAAEAEKKAAEAEAKRKAKEDATAEKAAAKAAKEAAKEAEKAAKEAEKQAAKEAEKAAKETEEAVQAAPATVPAEVKAEEKPVVKEEPKVEAKPVVESKPVVEAKPVVETKPVVKAEPKKETRTESKPAELPNGSAIPAVPAKACFRIQFLSSRTEIKKGDSRLKGLWPVYGYMRDGLWRYTYGEAGTRAELQSTIFQVRKDFGDAFVVQFDTSGTRIK